MTCRHPGFCTGVNPDTVNHINNSLQALVNLFYLIARDCHLDPELQPLVVHIQVELARISRLARELTMAEHGTPPKALGEGKRSMRPRHKEAQACL